MEPDLSNAGPFLAAAMVTNGTVSIPRLAVHTTQGQRPWRTILPQFGGSVDLVDGVRLTQPVRRSSTAWTWICPRPGTRSHRGGHVRLGHRSRRSCAASRTCAGTKPVPALTTEINRVGGNWKADGLVALHRSPARRCVPQLQDLHMATAAPSVVSGSRT